MRGLTFPPERHKNRGTKQQSACSCYLKPSSNLPLNVYVMLDTIRQQSQSKRMSFDNRIFGSQGINQHIWNFRRFSNPETTPRPLYCYTDNYRFASPSGSSPSRSICLEKS